MEFTFVISVAAFTLAAIVSLWLFVNRKSIKQIADESVRDEEPKTVWFKHERWQVLNELCERIVKSAFMVCEINDSLPEEERFKVDGLVTAGAGPDFRVLISIGNLRIVSTGVFEIGRGTRISKRGVSLHEHIVRRIPDPYWDEDIRKLDEYQNKLESVIDKQIEKMFEAES